MPAPLTCPGCGRELEPSTAAHGEAAPIADGYTMCLHCGTVCRFTKRLALRRSPEREWRRSSVAGELELLRQSIRGELYQALLDERARRSD